MRRGVKGLTPNVWGLSRQGVHHVNARRNAAGDLTWPGSRLNDDVSVHMKIVQCRRLLLGTSLAVHHRQGSPSVARPVAPAEPHWLFVALTGDDGRMLFPRPHRSLRGLLELMQSSGGQGCSLSAGRVGPVGRGRCPCDGRIFSLELLQGRGGINLS